MKLGSIKRFLTSRDVFGHPIQVVFKGRESFNSVTGGITTILMQILTTIIIIQALLEVFLMQDPKILSYPLPLSRQDRTELIPVMFHHYNYAYVVRLNINGKENSIP